MNSESSVRNIDYSLSMSNLEAAVELQLRQLGFIKDSEDVKVRFGAVKGPLGDILAKDKLIPLHLEIQAVKEVPVTINNA